MNELNRTAIFVAIAVVLSVITYTTMPTTELQSPAEMVGKDLFPKFEDPLEATSLEVVKFDKETATANTFRVAKIDNSWVIPSHSDYPADAEDQLGDVAAELIGLEVLSVATDPEEAGIASDDMGGLHELYGVIDPVDEDTSGGEGVGTRVVLRDKGDTELVGLVIGKEDPDQPGLRFVRQIGRDPVYTVKISTSKLSTKFEDWIEDDLLKLSGFDIRRIDIRDYGIDLLNGSIDERGEMSLKYNDTGDPRWELTADRVVVDDGWTDRGLAENEELNTETLNKLKNALDDLKIVDVVRKPKGLSDTLRSSGPIKLDAEAKNSLARRGFHLVKVTSGGQVYHELRSNEGDITAGMKDGVEYVLRFGQIAGMESGDEEKAEDAAKDEGQEGEDAGDDSGSGARRYLFVMAQLNPSMIEEPEYEPLPELPPEGDADEAAEAEGDAKPEEEGDGTQDESAEDADAAAEESEGEAEDAKPSREEIEKQREEIQKENDRKKAEYEDKIAEAKKEVEELNARFADWYYVIDNNEYQKIHLGRDDIVKEKEEEEEDGASSEATTDSPGAMPTVEPNSIEEFENLKQDRPEGEAAPEPMAEEAADPTVQDEPAATEPKAPTEEAEKPADADAPTPPADEPAAPAEEPATPPEEPQAPPAE